MAQNIDRQTLTKWYNCLDVKDSSEVNALLGPDSTSLLNEVRDVYRGRCRLYREGTWTNNDGRTALHVAVLRGNVNLVKRILEMVSDVDSVKQILGLPGNRAHGATGEVNQEADSSSTDFLSHLLQVKDYEYSLDALAMAVINCNRDIVDLLKGASLRSPTNPYNIICEDEVGASLSDETINKMSSAIDNEECPVGARKHVSTIIEKCLGKLQSVDKITELYHKNCDFNFLPMSEFLFHFMFADGSLIDDSEELRMSLEEVCRKLKEPAACEAAKCPGNASCKEGLWKYLLSELWDGQGRTPLHVAVDSGNVKQFRDFIGRVGADEALSSLLTAGDSGGRTPLYRAAAKGRLLAVEELLTPTRTPEKVQVDQGNKEGAVDVTQTVTYRADKWGTDLDLDDLSWSNGFKSDCVYVSADKLQGKTISRAVTMVSSIALQVAIIHKHADIVEKLSECAVPEDGLSQYEITCTRRVTSPQLEGETRVYETDDEVKAIQLGVMVGSVPIVQNLLKKAKEERIRKRLLNTPSEDKSFLLAAAMGSPNIIKTFIDHGSDRAKNLEDAKGNTLLHYALNGQSAKVYPHLTDFVGCEHVFSTRWEKGRVDQWLANPVVKSKENRGAEENGPCETYGQRKGSIILLLQAGVDIWKQNNKKITARPQPDQAPEDFVTWWYDQVANQLEVEQKNLSDAANAISVTATLVATASYVGPFSPPLGYGDSAVQVSILAVRFFVVCDNLSFYFALAAIMYALIPALPLPQESTFTKLKKTRILVVIALFFLFLSITSVIVAFAASYLAVTPDHGLGHDGFTAITIVAGGLVSFIALLRFLFRLVNIRITLPEDDTAYSIVIFTEFFVWDELKSILRNIRKKVKDSMAEKEEEF